MRDPVGFHTTAQPQQLARRRALPALLYAGHPLWRVHRVARHYSHLRSFSVLVSRATLRTNRENVQHREWPAQRGQRVFTCSSPTDHRGGGRACECECVSVCDLERVTRLNYRFEEVFYSSAFSPSRCLGGSEAGSAARTARNPELDCGQQANKARCRRWPISPRRLPDVRRARCGTHTALHHAHARRRDSPRAAVLLSPTL